LTFNIVLFMGIINHQFVVLDEINTNTN